jgi:hypothetical protein
MDWLLPILTVPFAVKITLMKGETGAVTAISSFRIDSPNMGSHCNPKHNI